MNVLVTRRKEQSDEFIKILEEKGHSAFSLPMIQICKTNEKPSSKIYDYTVITSVNSAKYSLEFLKNINHGKIAAVGSKTASFLEKNGFKADIIPEEFSAEGLIKSLLPFDLIKKSFLLPGPEDRSDLLPSFLLMSGACVEILNLYKTSPVIYEKNEINSFLKINKIDIITFASPSSADAFLSQGGDLANYMIIAIGKPTSDFLESKGINSVYPKNYTIEAMAELINDII